METSFNAPRVPRLFRCSEKDLYTIVALGWSSYAQYLNDFSDYKTTYTATTGTDQLAALASAKLLPDEAARDAAHAALRVGLRNTAIAAVNKWSDISSFIRDAFPTELYDIRRNEAGYEYFVEALRFDWESVSRLLDRGADFLVTYTTDLTTAGMPPAFIPAYTALRQQFQSEYLAFLNAEEQHRNDTDAKTTINNNLYGSLINMFDDAKKVFRNNATVRLQFTFDHIHGMINGGSDGNTTPTDSAKISGHIRDANTLAPLGSAFFRVYNNEGQIDTLANADGYFEVIVPKLGGPTAVSFEAAHMNYITQTAGGTLTPGELITQDFYLMPSPPPIGG